jgi:alstrom syndrome protein 1
VIQDNFAAPDLPLLTCLIQDQEEVEPDSLFQQSELEFAPLRWGDSFICLLNFLLL